MITVLADRHHYQLERYLHPSIQLETYDPVAGWTDSQLRNADAVLVRTTTPLNRKTLPPGNKLQFIGTASAGRDHLDVGFLESIPIHIADAKGSNAQSVAEYVAMAVLHYFEHSTEFSGRRSRETAESPSENAFFARQLTAGIIGAGFTGTATAGLLEAMNIRCKLYDPPREERENGEFRSVSLQEVLSCDIISFHVPITRTGQNVTWHWFDEEKIRAHPKKLVINASRGGVVDETALREAQIDGYVSGFICDVWENEPIFHDETLSLASLATPHIAGYSIEAKQEAARMICCNLHRYFNLPDPDVPKTSPIPINIPEETLSFSDIIQKLHPAISFDKSLRTLAGLPDEQKREAFLRLRQNVPLRNEFRNLKIPAATAEQFPILQTLGFQTDGTYHTEN